MIPTPEALPIDAVLPEIAARLRTSSGLVVCAPPGAGKTTRVPRALHESGFAENGEILILEPRRLAARLAAARVAAEFGESAGGKVGFTIRFENVSSPRTRIRFVTEGILARRIVADPLLAGISAVLLDEFHERHLTTDLALAFLRRLQLTGRPDLKVVVMSATIEPEPVSDFLGGAPVISSEVRRFPTTVEFDEGRGDAPLHSRVAAAVARLIQDRLQGDLLVFLPGAHEIRAAAEALRPLAARAGLLVLPLHGDLPADAQALAVEPAPQRKIILATNVAETSITIPGIEAVVDSGLARIAGHSAWSGLPLLSTARVSRASAEQRAGRAGRTRSGRVLRLYSRFDFERRPERDVPEVKRADLAETALTLHGAGIGDLRSFPWFEPPPEAALAAGEALLSELGALDADGSLAATGREMLRFPLHPRLARLVVESDRRGHGRAGRLLAALVAERDIRLEARAGLGARPRPPAARNAGASDLLELVDLFRAAEAARFDPDRIRSLGLDPRAVEAVNRARRQLDGADSRRWPPGSPHEEDEALLISVLTAFPDRIARRRSKGSAEFLLAGGGAARLAATSVVQIAPLIAAVDAEELPGRKGARDGPGVLIRLASEVRPEWLVEFFPGSVQDRVDLVWNERGQRVDEARRTLYRQLALEETVRPALPSGEASGMLFRQAYSKGPSAFTDGDRVAELQARIALLAAGYPDAGFPAMDETRVAAAAAACCTGRRSIAELAGVSLLDTLVGELSPGQRDLLRRETPERITLPRGRRVPVHYEPGKPPWIESALQDFLGMKTIPSVCSGRVPLTVRLLAPNRRPVQVTQDLPGFWKLHYPALRRQLMRRYPKHHWPE